MFFRSFYFTVPQPNVTLVIGESATPYVGNVISLVCNIQLSGALTTNEVSVSVRWFKDGTQTIKVSTGSISGGMFESILHFNSLLSSDSGSYKCKVTITAKHTSLVKKTSPQLILTVPSEY